MGENCLQQKLQQQAAEVLSDSIAVKQRIVDNHLDVIVEIANYIAKTLLNGGTLFLCGNGGSLADAQHLAAELLVRFRSQFDRKALPALCLATDMSTVTACANDYSFNEIFARSLAGLGKSGDAILGLSTSGKSKNVYQAFNQAKKMGIKTIGFLGGDGGSILELTDLPFIVPSSITARIQESHITVGHIIIELVEDILQEMGHFNNKI